MHVVIYENTDWQNFAPLSFSRPVFALATGTSTLVEKIIRRTAPSRLTLWVRPELAEYVRVRIIPDLPMPASINEPLGDGPALFIDGATMLATKIKPPTQQGGVLQGERVLAAYLASPGLAATDLYNATARWEVLQNLEPMPELGKVASRLWDLIGSNEQSITTDAMQAQFQPKPITAGPYHLVNEQKIWLSEGVALGPGCVLDATKGPILIAKNVSIGANAVVQGPLYVGPGAMIQPLALIRPGTSIGPGCKIGGEVSNTIFVGNTNKAHDGFIGDSYVGEWVNLAAATCTSNLKTTYGPISADMGSSQVPTGRQFLGSLIGDHAKTGIMTRLMTGTYVGYGSMVVASDIAPRFNPSFTFRTDKGVEPYRMEKALEVMKLVYARRQRPWTPMDEQMVHYVATTAAKVEQPAQ